MTRVLPSSSTTFKSSKLMVFSAETMDSSAREMIPQLLSIDTVTSQLKVFSDSRRTVSIMTIWLQRKSKPEIRSAGRKTTATRTRLARRYKFNPKKLLCPSKARPPTTHVSKLVGTRQLVMTRVVARSYPTTSRCRLAEFSASWLAKRPTSRAPVILSRLVLVQVNFISSGFALGTSGASDPIVMSLRSELQLIQTGK